MQIIITGSGIVRSLENADTGERLTLNWTLSANEVLVVTASPFVAEIQTPRPPMTFDHAITRGE